MNLTDLMKSLVEETTDLTEVKETETNISLCEKYNFFVQDIKKVDEIINFDDSLLIISFLDKLDISYKDLYILNHIIYSEEIFKNSDINEVDLEKPFLGLSQEKYDLIYTKVIEENKIELNSLMDFLQKEILTIKTFSNVTNTGKNIQSSIRKRINNSSSYRPTLEKNINTFI